MALLAAIVRDGAVAAQVGAALAGAHDVVWAPSWPAFLRLVRERPVSGCVVDLGAVAGDGLSEVIMFRRAYPRTGLVVLGSFRRRPGDLFRLGRSGVSGVVLLGIDDPGVHLRAAVSASLRGGVVSQVLREVGDRVPRRELVTLQRALDGVHRAWPADVFAERMGLSRPVLSERLHRVGLPSVGRLLLWARVLHGALWLAEPGRTAESVSRQLEYSSGAAFRRALRRCTGATPTEVIERRGLEFALGRFLDEVRLRRPSAWPGLRVVA